MHASASLPIISLLCNHALPCQMWSRISATRLGISASPAGHGAASAPSQISTQTAQFLEYVSPHIQLQEWKVPGLDYPDGHTTEMSYLPILKDIQSSVFGLRAYL